MAAFAAVLGFISLLNGIYSVVRILSSDVAKFLMSNTRDEDEENDYQIVIIWFTVIGALNITIGAIGILVHVYFTFRLRSALR